MVNNGGATMNMPIRPPLIKGGPLRFTVDDYFKLSESGILGDRRVELIGGEIIEMPAQGNAHAATIDEVRELLIAAFGPGYWVRSQYTLNLAPHGVPDPDIAVIPGDRRTPGADIPTGALLVVEVSDSRLTYDRTAKASLYAASGVKDYWIVNIPDRQLEIRRDPQPDATQEFGHGYATLTTLKPGATAVPLAARNGAVEVARLFF